MQFDIFNKTEVGINHDFWTRAFNYGARELGFEHFHSKVGCAFVPPFESKSEPQTLGATKLCSDGVLISIALTSGTPLKTFFHELTHAKQYLNRELVRTKRSVKWKGERWDSKHYSFSPWEEEANAAMDRLYKGFKRSEVMKQMQQPGANAYAVSVPYVPKDEVWAITSQREPNIFIQQFVRELEGHTEAFKAEVARGLLVRLEVKS